jgi:divalent metal cation (Fe/Co/Zn/Cd) transporter
LMGFAIALAWENKRLILGESLPFGEEREVREIVANSEGVDHLLDFRTVFFGPERVILAADVAFDADLDTAAIDRCISAIEDAVMDAEPQIRKVYIEPERPVERLENLT